MFIVMTGGMAGIAGTVFVLYATILANAIPNAAGHIAVCSVLGAPAAIVISLLMVPDPKRQHTGGRLDDVKQTASGTMGAIVQGTGAGLELLLNIVAMLVCRAGLSRQCRAWPVAGFSWQSGDAPARARLGHGADLLADGDSVVAGRHCGRTHGHQDHSQRARCLSRACGAAGRRARSSLRLIMLYAMCGFANFGSLGIMIAGLSTMCPGKRNEVSLGLKSIVSGTLTTCLLGAIVGVLA
jgi:CNT family concentrative nucleoside transporter